MNAESSYPDLIRRRGVWKSHILQVDSFLVVEWIRSGLKLETSGFCSISWHGLVAICGLTVKAIMDSLFREVGGALLALGAFH